MKPIQTIQKTIFATSSSALGISATRSISLAPVRNARRSNRSHASKRWTARRATIATTNPPAKMMVAATSRGTNSTNASAKLRQDCDERIGNFLNHRDLTPRPTSC